MSVSKTKWRSGYGNQGDAVILHGMLSNAGNMAAIARAIEKREHYRKVVRFNLPSWTHTAVPQAMAEMNAVELARKRIKPGLARGTLEAPIDLIGHSNGGYVCLVLARELGPKIIRNVFTLGTPSGLDVDYGLTKALRSRVFHFRGGQDAVPTGRDHNPGEGNIIITFPDEGHCSLHQAADFNGVADLICYLGGMENLNILVDSGGLIHPWPWCRNEAIKPPDRTIRQSGHYTVCDGMHDALLDWMKAARNQIVSVPVGKLAHALPVRLGIYLAIRQRLSFQQEALDEALAEARAFGRGQRKELAAIKAEADAIAERLEAFEMRAKGVVATFKRECGHDVRELRNALDLCVSLASGPVFADREMAEINALLEVALLSHGRLNNRIHGRLGLTNRRTLA